MCAWCIREKTLDRRYLQRRAPNEKWSRPTFPNTNPPRKDFQLWETALRQIVPPQGLLDRLKEFFHEGYKIWLWRYDPSGPSLHYLRPVGMDVYQKVQGACTHSTTCWELTQEGATRDESGKWCTVQHNGNDRQVILSMVGQPCPKEMPETILDVLREWGCIWMWRSLCLIADDHWLEDAIEVGI